MDKMTRRTTGRTIRRATKKITRRAQIAMRAMGKTTKRHVETTRRPIAECQEDLQVR